VSPLFGRYLLQWSVVAIPVSRTVPGLRTMILFIAPS